MHLPKLSFKLNSNKYLKQSPFWVRVFLFVVGHHDENLEILLLEI